MFMPTEEDDAPSYASEPYTEDSAYWSTFDTDRTLYRRTDTINAWGVVRARPSRDVPATVVVELFSALDGDAAQAPLWTTEVHPNQVGAYSTSIALDDLPEGAYDVMSRVGNKVVGSTSIEIARILKPAYRLEVTTGRRVYFVGDRIKVTATATFFEGSPVPGVPLRADGL
jgi:uncharacterized protein YfaS (alpha-2-macroglobulin family)